MADRPLVSVIIPAYHAELYISRALLGILNQTYPQGLIELIVVVDDYKHDSTCEIIDTVFPYAHIIEHAHKTSPAKARNLAISHAHGKYIAFLDADDEWRPKHLENAVGILEESPDVDVYYAKCIEITEGRAFKSHGISIEWIEEYCPAPHSTVIVRNPPAAKFDERLKGADDWKWLLDLYDHGDRFYFNPEVESYYYVHAGNLTGYSGRWHRQEFWCFWHARRKGKAIRHLLSPAVKEWLMERLKGWLLV